MTYSLMKNMFSGNKKMSMITSRMFEFCQESIHIRPVCFF